MTSFEGLFDKARVGTNCADADYQAFNEDISGWKMPGVQNMATMFQDATSFNQDISSWDVGEVTTMYSMFRGSTAFNSPIFTTTAKVTTMEGMFREATSFNQDVSAMSVGEVTTIYYMFYLATSFNSPIFTATAKGRVWDICSGCHQLQPGRVGNECWGGDDMKMFRATASTVHLTVLPR